MSNTRELNIYTHMEILGNQPDVYLYVDGKRQGPLPNDRWGAVDIDYNSHKIFVVLNEHGTPRESNGIIVPANDLEYAYEVNIDFHVFKPTKVTLVENEKVSKKNKQILAERQVFHNIKSKIDSVFNEIARKQHPITKERDYSLLKNLPDYCKKSDYFKKIVGNIGVNICNTVADNYFCASYSVDRFYKAMVDLADLYLLEHKQFPALNHYKYMIEENNIVNSVLSENPIEDLKKIETREFLRLLPDEIYTAYHDAEDLYKQKKYLPAFEKALHTSNSREDLDNIKRALILGAMIEGNDADATNFYQTFSFINRKTFGRFTKDGNLVVEYLNVDMLIAEAIRLSKTSSVNNLNKDLDNFFKLTARIYHIESMQYNILQKVFSYLNAYDQEKMVLEAMVENHIVRTPEQEERLNFLKSHKAENNTSYSAMPSTVDETDGKGNRKFLYEYRTVIWNEREIKDYFDSLSIQNQTTNLSYVVNEWTKNVTVNNAKYDYEVIENRVSNILKEVFDDKFHIIPILSGPTGTLSECDVTVLVGDVSEDGYPWLSFNIVGDQIMKNKISLSIYTMYTPEFDDNLSESNIERNKQMCEKVVMLKQKQNPKLNNYIQTITDVIISELEKWLNSQTENNIYE